MQEKKGQAALEYLIIIAAVIAVAAIVVLFVTGSFGTQKEKVSFAQCKQAASDCMASRLVSSSDPCVSCEDACVSNGKDIMTGVSGCDPNGACGLCKQGKPASIYEVNCSDLDNDGYAGNTTSCLIGSDCNDSNASINPGATESCTNGVDDDCDGKIDCADSDCVTQPVCACVDSDGDGYYAVNPDCPTGSDCDDSNAAVNPGATEICNNGIDDNCNGYVDCDDDDCYSSCPFADFSATCTDNGDGTVTANFDASMSYDPDADPSLPNQGIISYYWIFENGNPPDYYSSDPLTFSVFPSFSPPSRITLTVEDADNNKKEVYHFIDTSLLLPGATDDPTCFVP